MCVLRYVFTDRGSAFIYQTTNQTQTPPPSPPPNKQTQRRAEAAAAAASRGRPSLPSTVSVPPELEEDGQEQPLELELELSVEGAVQRLCGHLDPLQPALADRGVSYGHTLLWIAEHIRCV